MDTSDEQQSYISTMQWVLGFGSDWAQADATPTANAPKTIEAIEWQMKLLDAKLIPVGMATLDTRNLFKDGKAAFMIDGPWVMTLVKTDNADLYPSIGYAAPPTPTHAAITGGAFFTIPKGAANKDLAWQYIDMINQEDWQRRWLEDLVQIPGQSVPASDAFLADNPWVANIDRDCRQVPGGIWLLSPFTGPGHQRQRVPQNCGRRDCADLERLEIGH